MPTDAIVKKTANNPRPIGIVLKAWPASAAGRRCAVSFAFALLSLVSAGAPPNPPPGMAFIPGGTYKPLYAKEAKPRAVEPFFIDAVQVTNAEFLEFVKRHPEWRRSSVKRTLADASYLRHWAGDFQLGSENLRDAPVTNVSWFAAKAYCEANGKRLPTQDEWEFVARADATRLDATGDQAFLRLLLEWYSRAAPDVPPSVRTSGTNIHGVRGLHRLVWEWVHDFNSTMVVGDSRGDGSLERRLFCGAGALLASDVSNYAAFMRYAFRSSLKGGYCVSSLGFRGARSVRESPPAPATPQFATIYDLPGEWRNQADAPLELDRLRGKARIVSLGFTRCKFACPRTLSDMQRIEAALGADADRVGFVFFSIDPENDIPAAMASKMAELKMDPSRWTFLTAPAGIVQQLAVALNFKFQFVEGLFAHSNLIAVLDADGNVVQRDEALGADIEPIVGAVRRILRP